MTDNVTSMKIGGGFTFWRVAESTSRNALKLGLSGLGLLDFLPEPRTYAACLRSALEELYAERCYMVRGIASRDGFSVTKETRGDKKWGNRYEQQFVASVDKQSNISVECDTNWNVRVSDVKEAYDKQLGLLAPAQVTQSLVAYIESVGGSKYLRPTGGIYWLPAPMLNDFRKMADVMEGVAVVGKTGVYIITHSMDGEAVRAIRDAIVAEAAVESKRIHDDIMSGELGDRALETRHREAQDFRDKISLYERLLDTGLGELRQAIDTAEQGIAGAVLQESMSFTE